MTTPHQVNNHILDEHIIRSSNRCLNLVSKSFEELKNQITYFQKKKSELQEKINNLEFKNIYYLILQILTLNLVKPLPPKGGRFVLLLK